MADSGLPCLELLRATPGVLRGLMVDLADEDARWKPAPDRFSVAEVLAHLSHSEGHCYRMRLDRFLAETRPTFAPDDAQMYLVEQRLWLRGVDVAKPALILLHGGPGASEAALFRHFNADLEQAFLVVYWEQRGAGRSYRESIPPASMTIAQFVRDLDEVVELVRARFHKRPGRPPRALVGTGDRPAVCGASSREGGGVRRRRTGRRHGRGRACIVRLCPSRSGALWRPWRTERPSRHRSTASRRGRDADVAQMGGALRRRLSRRPGDRHADLGCAADGRSERDRFAQVRPGQPILADAPVERVPHARPRPPAHVLAVPVGFMLGRHDWQVPSILAARYFDWIDAPHKRLIWFERSAHNPPFEEPERFNRAVVDVLAPLIGSEPVSDDIAGYR